MVLSRRLKTITTICEQGFQYCEDLENKEKSQIGRQHQKINAHIQISERVEESRQVALPLKTKKSR